LTPPLVKEYYEDTLEDSLHAGLKATRQKATSKWQNGASCRTSDPTIDGHLSGERTAEKGVIRLTGKSSLTREKSSIATEKEG
jgi:hypothetical protein